MARVGTLIYQGKDGDRQGDFFNGVPARDLDETDIARLTDEQYAAITAAHPMLGPLYVPEKRESVKASRPSGKDE